MSWWPNLLRRARLRNLTDDVVQHARVETCDADVKDNVERWQDDGFAAHPVDGQGLVLNVMGHTIVVRMDHLGERPVLQPYEVSVWHKEGHKITLKNDGVVEATCTTLLVSATKEVSITAPKVVLSGDLTVQGTVTGSNDVVGGGKSLKGHTHKYIDVSDAGPANSMTEPPK